MEIFMHHIPHDRGEYDVKVALASHLHGPNFPNIKPNFRVDLHFVKKGARTLTGTFTLADLPVAERFLEIYGGELPREVIRMGNNQIYFSQSVNRPHPDVLDLLSRSRWIDPAEEREQNARHQKLHSSYLSLMSVQVGWMCRDNVFSIEGETNYKPCYLSFDPERREVQITFPPKNNQQSTYVIAIRQQSILSTSTHASRWGNQSFIHLQLEVPPMFLRRKSQGTPFYRLSTFPFKTLHPRATPYISLAIRLALASRRDLIRFQNLAKLANLHHEQTNPIAAECRELFTDVQLDSVEENILRFDWCVAFQLEGLLRNMDLDATELLGLLPRVEELVKSHGSSYVADLLRTFGRKVHTLSHTDKDTIGLVLSCLDSCHQELAKQENPAPPILDDILYQSFHVMVTPTTMFLTGPFPERSNRVIRRYGKRHEESFLRVEFREEDGLQFRLDRDVNGRAFIRDRIGPILKDRLMVAGRKFEFLAYSQSALREHSVW